MKVILFDSSYLVYRSYFAFNQNHLSVDIDGEKIITSAIFGFLRELIKVSSLFKYDFIITAWDSPPYLKKQKYAYYKENRKIKLPKFDNEREIIQEILAGLAVPCLYERGYEGEDIAKFIISKLEGDNVDLYTNDEDTYALLNNNVKLLNVKFPKGKKYKGMKPYYSFFGKEDLKEEYGITPKQFRKAKAISGCQSDHVPGVKGIGMMGAIDLIKRFKTIKEMVANVNIILKEKPKIGEKLTEAIKNGKLKESKFLTKILLPECIHSIERRDRKLSYTTILEEIEARTLLTGNNRLILNSIMKRQQKIYDEIKERIGWKC